MQHDCPRAFLALPWRGGRIHHGAHETWEDRCVDLPRIRNQGLMSCSPCSEIPSNARTWDKTLTQAYADHLILGVLTPNANHFSPADPVPHNALTPISPRYSRKYPIPKPLRIWIIIKFLPGFQQNRHWGLGPIPILSHPYGTLSELSREPLQEPFLAFGPLWRDCEEPCPLRPGCQAVHK